MTRYPKSGKGRKWTVKELNAIPASWKGDVLGDGDGLSGEVRVAQDGAASVRWRYAFKWQGKVQWFQCGTWPTVALEAVREARDWARQQVKDGKHPMGAKQADKIEAQQQVEAVLADEVRRAAENATFGEMFEAWIADGVARKDGNKELRRSFDKDVLLAIGDTPVRSVSEQDVRGLLRDVVERGANRMAACIHRDLVQVFAWGEQRKPWRALLTEGNPARLIDIGKVVSPDYDLAGERDRVLSASEIRELRDLLAGMEENRANAPDRRATAHALAKPSQLALWICLSTLCRIGELMLAEWKHVDLKAGTWFVPKENAKATNGTRHDLLVFLSPFALRQFAALQELSGDSPWCFPSRNDPETHLDVTTVTKQVGDRQCRFKDRQAPAKRRNDDTLVLANGDHGKWTPHDLRRTGATMMQSLRVPLDVIDRCQNHVLAGSKVRRHYLHYDYAVEKREAWTLLGERIEAILAGDNVVTFPARRAA